MYDVFLRIMKKKHEAGKTWDEIIKEAKIPLRSWMVGIPCSSPTEKELKALAPVLNTTYEWLKNGD
jgi:hypothetical protein